MSEDDENDLNEAYGCDLERDIYWSGLEYLPKVDRNGYPMFSDDCLPPEYGTYSEEELHTRDYIYDDERSDASFEDLCRAGIKARYGDPVSEDVMRRFEEELACVLEDESATSYMFAMEATRWAHTRGIITTPGRGAYPCSIICFALGITEIDPMAFDLPLYRIRYDSDSGFPTIWIGWDNASDRCFKRYFADTLDDPITQSRAAIMPELGIMRHAIDNIALATHETIDSQKIPFDAPEALDFLASQNLCGIPRFEDVPRMQEALAQLASRSFPDLMAIVALSEQDAIDARLLWDYVCASNDDAAGRLPVQVDPALAETHGRIVFQEQVIQLARRIGGFSGSEARAILMDAYNRKIEHLTVCEQTWSDGTTCTTRAHWIREAEAQGIPAADAAAIFGDICRDAPYASCKGHTIANAMNISRLAWLKAHHPREFMAAVLEVRHAGCEEFDEPRLAPDRDEPQRISKREGEDADLNENIARESYRFQDTVDACLAMGIPLLLPDINRSDRFFCATPEGILTGLADVRNVNTVAADAIIAAREKTPAGFTSLTDYMAWVRGKARMVDTIRMLVKAGAFDSLEHNRRKLAASIAYDSTFCDDPDTDWDPRRRDFFEREAIGFEIAGSGTGCSGNPHAWYKGMQEHTALGSDFPVTTMLHYKDALAGDRAVQDAIADELTAGMGNAMRAEVRLYLDKNTRQAQGSSAGGARNAFISRKVNEGMETIERWAER